MSLVCWFFGVLARPLPISLVQQALLQQVLLNSDDGRSEDGDAPSVSNLFVIFVTFGVLYTIVDGY